MPETRSWSNFSIAQIAGIGAEAVVITITCRGLIRGQKVLIKAWVNVTTAAASTNPFLRLRRGTTATGTQIGEDDNISLAASLTEEASIWAEDNAAGDDQSYTLTIGATTGTVTVNTAGIQAEITGP